MVTLAKVLGMKFVLGPRTLLSLLLAAGALACDARSKPKGGPTTGDDAATASGQLDAAVPASGGPDAKVVGNPQNPDGNVTVLPTSDAGGVLADAAGSRQPDSGPATPTCSASAAPVLPALKLQAVAGITGLSRIIYAAQPKGSSDWYLVQHTGTIHLLRAGALSSTLLLDVSSQIDQNLDPNDERGLLSVAFPPDFASSNKFYIGITPTKDSTGFPANADSVIEYQASAGGVGPSTRLRTINQLSASATNHNGGTLVFGGDGLLYYGTGDGGEACNTNQPGAPQDVNKLFGKILRFDPSVAAAPYAAAGNPFAGGGGDPRVLHYGLRNPFRYGFDRMTGDLYIGDVGQDTYEEADFAPAGSSALNFGWARFEGNHEDTCPSQNALESTLRDGSTHTPPIVDIKRSAGATGPFADYKSIIGGYVYRGSALPTLQGVYIFGDYTGKRMGALTQCGSVTSPVTVIQKKKDANDNTAAFTYADGQAALDALTAIVTDDAGELYFVANRSSLLKLVPGP